MSYVLIYKNSNYEAAMVQAKSLEKLNEKIAEITLEGEMDGDTWEETQQLLFSVKDDVLTQEHNWSSQMLPYITLD